MAGFPARAAAVPTPYRVVQVVQNTAALKLMGRTCNVKFSFKIKNFKKILFKLFSIKYQYKPERPLYMLGKRGELYSP